jgi:hypothetical protein
VLFSDVVERLHAHGGSPYPDIDIGHRPHYVRAMRWLLEALFKLIVAVGAYLMFVP